MAFVLVTLTIGIKLCTIPDDTHWSLGTFINCEEGSVNLRLFKPSMCALGQILEICLARIACRAFNATNKIIRDEYCTSVYLHESATEHT